MDASQLMVWLVVALVAAGVVVAVVLAVRRHRWIQSLKERGWRFVDNPKLESVLTLSCPPFGQGFRRDVDDQVLGEAGPARTPFQVVEYRSEHGSHRVAALRLPLPLPELHVSSGPSPRVGVAAAPHPHPRWQVRTDDPAFADTVLRAAAGPLEALAALGPVDLSVDGQDLVALGVPREADELAPLLEALAAVVASLPPQELERFRQPDPEHRFRFYRRPDWVFHGDRDDMLSRVRHTRGGFGHQAEQVVTGTGQGLPFIALRHRWKTQRTVVESDGKGGTRTRTVTDHHSEDLFEMTLPAPWPLLGVGGGGWFRPGEKVELEWEQFNDRFPVRSTHPRFAYDVLHPRQMEYLMAAAPPAFEVDGTVLRVSSQHDSEWLWRTVDVLTGFLARVPGWVWKNVGAAEPPPFTRAELG
ncbi:hypothetical protein GC722_15060 [Auraticoccus sp. F435]|uniref:DUF3137 domain-containing protein n=1 Tax=Auraticoccus cholistanensis TaxID=2656650 RepID=A0A6A9V1K3_9ACTN|nr:hypothetical protein [Auraticoccus cholistanensis]MVA77330.1 hypothetical protein [Auraticoccus cholistanensis]